MITAIEIENFKAVGQRQRLALRPITLLVGPNSGGKSTIIHALHYAREIFERRNLNADRTINGGSFVDLGGFANFVHEHDQTQSVSLRFDLDTKDTGLPYVLNENFSLPEADIDMDHLNASVASAWVEVVVKRSVLRDALYVQRYSVGINGQPFAAIEADFDAREVRIVGLDFHHPLIRAMALDEHPSLLEEYFELLKPAGAQQSGPTDTAVSLGSMLLGGQVDALPVLDRPLDIPLKATEPDDEQTREASEKPEDKVRRDREREITRVRADTFRAILTQLIVAPGRVLLDTLRGFRYLGPLRELPPRNFEPPRYRDETRWATGLAAWDALTESEELRREASAWLSAPERLNAGCELKLKRYREVSESDELGVALAAGRVFDTDEEVIAGFNKLETSRRVVLVDAGSGLELRAHDVGVGISQVVPVVVAALDPAAAVVAIEQPELHVHPTLQASLADLLIQGAIGLPGRQFLVETHSIHLILRLQRRIRETARGATPETAAVSAAHVAMIYTARENEAAAVSDIALDSQGELLRPWPDAFLDQDYQERFA